MKKLYARLGRGGTIALIMSIIAVGALAWGLFFASSTASISTSGGMAGDIDMGAAVCSIGGSGVIDSCVDNGDGSFDLTASGADDTTEVSVEFANAINNGSTTAYLSVVGQDAVPEVQVALNLNGGTLLPGASVNAGVSFAFKVMFKLNATGLVEPLTTYTWPAIDLTISDTP